MLFKRSRLRCDREPSASSERPDPLLIMSLIGCSGSEACPCPRPKCRFRVDDLQAALGC